MKPNTVIAAGAALGLAVGALALVPTIGSATPTAADVSTKSHSKHKGPKVRGLSDNGKLLTFRLGRPDKVWKVKIKGLEVDTELVGIDYRPANGTLYGVGDLGGVYTISGSGDAAKVSQLSALLDGENFGVDFNPTVDRLRIVSDTGQNLRHDVDGSLTTVDTPLSTPPTVGTTTGVSAAAYLNNDASTDTATLLYDINPATDQLVVQAPANNGTLNAVGSLGVDAAASAGFDIVSKLDGDKAVANHAFAVLHVDGRARLYYINLTTGSATKINGFARGTGIQDLAIATG